MPQDAVCRASNSCAGNAGSNDDHAKLRCPRVLRHTIFRVVMLLGVFLLFIASFTLSLGTAAQSVEDVVRSFSTRDALHSIPPVLSEDTLSHPGNEVALRYTFGGGNLVLVLSKSGFLHAYHLESGKLAWSVDVGGDMISVEVDMPPSRDTILRDPLALPFYVHGNSLFTRIPFYTYNPTASSNVDTRELLGNLPNFLRPYFFMNISTLLRRQTIFFGGTDIFVTTSIEVADIDSHTGRRVNQQRHGGSRRGGKRNASRRAHEASRGNASASASASSFLHNELFPILHMVRYNIVLHVVKTDMYSWSIMLSQLQLSPRTSLSPLHRRGAETSTTTTPTGAAKTELKEHNSEANPRFFSHLMRDLFDFDVEHSVRGGSNTAAYARHHRTVVNANLSEVKAELSPQIATAAVIAALERRRTQVAQDVSRVLSMEQFNKSRIRLHNLLEGTTTWTATLPSSSRVFSSFGLDTNDENGQEVGLSLSSHTSTQVAAAYVWVSGADQIFRIPVQRTGDLNMAAPSDEASVYDVYAESTPENTNDAEGHLWLTSPAYTGAVVPMQGTLGGLQLVPFLHEAGGGEMSHTLMAMDVEGDEREGAELDRYYYERSWWEPHVSSSPPGAPRSHNADNPFAGFSNSGDVVRTGLAWRTAGIISFHVLCLAGSIAFLCAGVPPRNQLQRAWAQADRNRDRVSHNSASHPQSTQLLPQDLLNKSIGAGGGGSGGAASPLSPTIDGFSVDLPTPGDIGLVMKSRSPSPARVDEDDNQAESLEKNRVKGEKDENQNAALPHKRDRRASQGTNARTREEDGDKPAHSAGRSSTTTSAAEGKALTSSYTTLQSRRSLTSELPLAIHGNGERISSAVSTDERALSRPGSSSDDDSEEIDMGERWWVRAQHRSQLPSVAVLDETNSDKTSSVCFSPVHEHTEEEGKLFQLHFKVLEKIGFGGEGCVFCVEHRVTHARYAIKAILIHEQDEERVVQEAVLHSSFDNANVVRFYFCWIEDIAVSTADRLQLCNVGEDGLDTMSLGLSSRSLHVSSPVDDTFTDEDNDDTVVGDSYHMLFIQMEYFPRGTLADWLRSRKGFFRLEVLRYMQNIADGLAYLHNQDVVHRDLKPTNIFVSNSNVLKIGDFGLAKRRVATASSNGDLASNVVGQQQERSVVGGSPLYCSPEQTRGDPVNKASDIFSFGIIAVEMFCTFATLHERIRILTDAHQGVLPAEIERDFPEEVQIIKPLLAKDPQQRPPLRKVQRQLLRLIDTLEDSGQDAEDFPHSPAEIAGPTQLVPPVSTAQVTTFNSHSSRTRVAAISITTGTNNSHNSSLLRNPTAVSFSPSSRPAADCIVHRTAAAGSHMSDAQSAVASQLELETHGDDTQALPEWQSPGANASPFNCTTPLPQRPHKYLERQRSASSVHSTGLTRHRNSYHNRRYASSNSSPGAEATSAATQLGSSSPETALQGGMPSTTPAELIVTDPYGPPTTPVTYVGDADLSSILMRDLQERTISPPD